MRNNLKEAIAETLKWEGGYSNVPGDAGGPTNYGITIADVRKYVNPTATANDVKALTKDQAIDIYAKKYWKTAYYDCDKLASGVDFSVFDFGVNSGPARAKQYLDKSVGGSNVETINKLNAYRQNFVEGIVSRNATQAKFLKGWTSRISGVRAKAILMNQRPTTTIQPSDGAAAGTFAAAMAAFITGHKALIALAGALFIAWAIATYLENRKTSK